MPRPPRRYRRARRIVPMTQPRRILRPEVFLIAIVVLTGIRPGDAPWVNDEPIMMEMAIRYNHTGSNIYGFYLPFTPCPYGLQGTRGERYGPLPIWLDQVFLTFTRNLPTMVAWRALLFSSIIATALYCLARTLRLNQWYAVITMLSPWLWIYSRSLWDSTWCIPLSAGLFASYAEFLVNSRRWAFRLSIICVLLLSMVHLMSMAIILPVALHLVIFQPRYLWRWKWDATVILGIWIYLFRPYLIYSLTHFESTHLVGPSAWLGWLFPMLGGQFLTLGAAGMSPADGWQLFAPAVVKSIFAAAREFSWLALILVWLGMILSLPRAWSVLRKPAIANAADHICLIALAVWIFQTALDGTERVYSSAHYYGGTWLVFIFFAWQGMSVFVSRFKDRRIIIALLAAYAACLIAGITIIAWTIAGNAGTPGVSYGTSIANQIRAVNEIQKFSENSIVDIKYPNWRRFPLAMKVLMELNPPQHGTRQTSHLVVKYRAAYPGDARIEVQDLNP